MGLVYITKYTVKSTLYSHATTLLGQPWGIPLSERDKWIAPYPEHFETAIALIVKGPD